jgi:hypothetical protein
MRHDLLPLLASVTLLVIPVPRAFAAGIAPTDATQAQKKGALGPFVAGKQALESKDWDRAIRELSASLDIVDSPNARLELARALRDSGKLGDSWTEYGRTIDDANRLAAREERYAKTASAATAEREELSERLSFVTVGVANAPPGAALRVGGRSVPSAQWGAPVVTSPGAVDVVVVDGGGKELARRTVSLVAGEKTAVALDAGPPAVGATCSPAAPTSDDQKAGEADRQRAREVVPETPPAKSTLRPYAYLASGIAIAGLATFAVLGLISNSTFGDLQAACRPGCPPDKRSEIDTGRMQQTIANVGLGVGLVSLAAGATLWLVSAPPRSPTGGAALVVAPTFIGLRGSL